MKKIQIALLGASGRMGRMIAAEIQSSADLELCAAITRMGGSSVGQKLGAVEITDQIGAMHACDVAIDFAVAESMVEHARAAAQMKKPIVSGVSGYTPADYQELQKLSAQIPVFHALNMSRGVFVMNQLLAQAAKLLDADYQIEIAETHHNKKADAPSGTALLFARSVAASRGLDEKSFRFGRQGQVGARTPDEIGIHALRMGNVVGEHTVHFASANERLEFTHKASDRSLFARGAIDAARWLVRQKPGFYGMKDLVGI